ncbi:MAG: hypothetical protein GY697_21355 [Desulfobacterales bacterium]|nr:hypothetical protein [Desulfobacterales bacterium]
MALLQSTHEAPSHRHASEPGYTCVEFHIQNMGAVYQSKIWEVPLKGLFFLVKEGSAVLAHLRTGEEIKARYTPVNRRKPGGYIKTKIRYIIQEQTGRFKGHYLVGLALMEEPE